MNTVIEVKNLHKNYGDYTAVDDVSFNVERGQIFGIVGPNGAGKTSTVECVSGLRWPYDGSVQVLGFDPHHQRAKLAQRIGIQLQQAQIPNRIKVWEALDLFSSFYAETVPWEPLLDTWGLSDKRNDRFENLSGGQKQRLFIALALLNDPEIVFLDELTTGLDPQARRQTWDLVIQIREQGKTVVLVTHFMDEVEALCDRVAIIDHGKIIALDTPDGLLHTFPTEKRVIFDSHPELDLSSLQNLGTVTKVEAKLKQVTAFGSADNLVSSIVLALESQGIPITNLRTIQPNLEDVFIALTGRALRA